ncbi:MAG: succinyl-diaminopimelate desuccinylase [Gammaproteobacteria bacterium]|nr:succinyl-diaminopimelate desuccinylase [Gammaproteobacteria bacterium]
MNNQSATVELTRDLIRCQSISPNDAGCQAILTDRLARMGFSIEAMPFEDVSNLWATRGEGSPLFVFAGHTDVVPAGSLEQWQSDPFHPVLSNGCLYGRGSADMKGSLAAMITALEKFLNETPNPKGTLGVLITSDEEADAINGTVRVMESLSARGISIDMCIVGEPSSDQQVGDVIRVGRRGSLGGRLTVKGTQGHVAYAEKADNPIHKILDLLSALTRKEWDQGNSQFPPTRFQISNIHAGTGATNVIPGEVEVLFNFRFSTETDAESLQRRVNEIIASHDLDSDLNYALDWNLSGNPFLTTEGKLIPATLTAIRNVMNIDAELSTSGGTSDGRFIAPTGTEVVELGPCNSTIHQVNESVATKDLDQLSDIYFEILKQVTN